MKIYIEYNDFMKQNTCDGRMLSKEDRLKYIVRTMSDNYFLCVCILCILQMKFRISQTMFCSEKMAGGSAAVLMSRQNHIFDSYMISCCKFVKLHATLSLARVRRGMFVKSPGETP